MFPQKSSPISIFRKALLLRSLHHLLCILDVIVFLFLPVVVLPFVLVLHLVVFSVYLQAMSAAWSRLAASNDAAGGIAPSGDSVV